MKKNLINSDKFEENTRLSKLIQYFGHHNRFPVSGI